jgi:hypothetical protein
VVIVVSPDDQTYQKFGLYATPRCGRVDGGRSRRSHHDVLRWRRRGLQRGPGIGATGRDAPGGSERASTGPGRRRGGVPADRSARAALAVALTELEAALSWPEGRAGC